MEYEQLVHLISQSLQNALSSEDNKRLLNLLKSPETFPILVRILGSCPDDTISLAALIQIKNQIESENKNEHTLNFLRSSLF